MEHSDFLDIERRSWNDWKAWWTKKTQEICRYQGNLLFHQKVTHFVESIDSHWHHHGHLQVNLIRNEKWDCIRQKHQQNRRILPENQPLSYCYTQVLSQVICGPHGQSIIWGRNEILKSYDLIPSDGEIELSLIEISYSIQRQLKYHFL